MPDVNRPGQPDLSIIDQIPWLEFSHAYGTAIDVPDQLKALLSPDADKRRKTFFSFTCNLFHQGTVYSATVPAIEIFQHLLRYRDVPDKAQILETLLAFAVGYPEDINGNVDLAALLFDGGDEGEDPGAFDPIARECYLTVAAGVPLYEALLQDHDPRTVISAAYVLAYFPAHAFASCERLLRIAQDASRHDFVRSSALMACSFLAGGATAGVFFQTLCLLVEQERSDLAEPVPLLIAAATYCLLREDRLVNSAVREHADPLADRCLEHDVRLPGCDFYTFKDPVDPNDPYSYDVQALLMPDPQFPWGSLVSRLQKITNRKSAAMMRRSRGEPRRKPTLPDPASFSVTPGVFERENVVAAVCRYHANLIGDRKNIVQAHQDFAPFKPYAMLAWDEILRWLDSDEVEVRWAAAALLEELGPLDEAAVESLIERLHANNNSSLGRVVLKQNVTPRQCADLCERLCGGKFVRGNQSTNRDDFRSIVVRHGTPEQLWQLYERGEEPERSSAGHALLQRQLIDSTDRRVYEIFAADLLTNDYGRAMAAKCAFARSEPAQHWFFAAFDSLPQTYQFAVADAMESFRADLSPLVDDLLAKITLQQNPVIQAKLTGLLKTLGSVDERLVDRLLGLTDGGTSPLLRVAVVRVLGSWLAKPEVQQRAAGALTAFLADESPRVRRAVLDQVTTCDDALIDRSALLRRALSDSDSANVRCAMWNLASVRQLIDEDLIRLLSEQQPDRVTAETLLAWALRPQEHDGTAAGRLQESEERPLTTSVLQWSRSASGGVLRQK